MRKGGRGSFFSTVLFVFVFVAIIRVFSVILICFCIG